MLNRSASLVMSTNVLEALPSKLDIKRHSSSILYIGGQVLCLTHFPRAPDNNKHTFNTGYSTANIKALRGSLGALSVNKLSQIPKLQPISAVYENQ